MSEKNNLGCGEVAKIAGRVTLEGTIIGVAYLVNPIVGVLAVFGAMAYENRQKIKNKLQRLDQKIMSTLGE